MSTHPYHNSSQQRALKVMLCLFGHEIDGLSPSQIARAVQAEPSAITRDIYNLVKVGVAERLPHNDNVRISPLLGRKAMQILTALDSASTGVACIETGRRFAGIEVTQHYYDVSARRLAEAVARHKHP